MLLIVLLPLSYPIQIERGQWHRVLHCHITYIIICYMQSFMVHNITSLSHFAPNTRHRSHSEHWSKWCKRLKGNAPHNDKKTNADNVLEAESTIMQRCNDARATAHDINKTYAFQIEHISHVFILKLWLLLLLYFVVVFFHLRLLCLLSLMFYNYKTSAILQCLQIVLSSGMAWLFSHSIYYYYAFVALDALNELFEIVPSSLWYTFVVFWVDCICTHIAHAT